jgi:hypothetical protein
MPARVKEIRDTPPLTEAACTAYKTAVHAGRRLDLRALRGLTELHATLLTHTSSESRHSVHSSLQTKNLASTRQNMAARTGRGYCISTKKQARQISSWIQLILTNAIQLYGNFDAGRIILDPVAKGLDYMLQPMEQTVRIVKKKKIVCQRVT